MAASSTSLHIQGNEKFVAIIRQNTPSSCVLQIKAEDPAAPGGMYDVTLYGRQPYDFRHIAAVILGEINKELSKESVMVLGVPDARDGLGSAKRAAEKAAEREAATL